MALDLILAKVGALPGVTSAGTVGYPPMEQNREWGAPAPKDSGINGNNPPDAMVYVVTPGYFLAMGMRLGGRDFTWNDRPKGPGVIILNETVTRFLFPGQDPLGKTVSVNGVDRQIIGGPHRRAREQRRKSAELVDVPPLDPGRPAGVQLVVRTNLPPSALASNASIPRASSIPSSPSPNSGRSAASWIMLLRRDASSGCLLRPSHYSASS